MGKDTRSMEVSKRANTNLITHNVRGGAKSTEFSLPQAQAFYISSRNKFMLVKTTNLSLSLLLCPAVLQFLAPQLFRSPPDPA